MTPRQRKILEAIINEFMESAEAVGSLAISEKYNLGVSPATIRSEMADLVRQGYITMSHSSSGRVPTTTGIRYYINELMGSEDPNYIEEIEIARRIFESRFAKEKLVKQSVNVAAEISRCLSIALLEDVNFVAGVSDLIRYPEFQDVEKLKSLLAILENYQIMSNLFSKVYRDSEKGVKIIIGEETEIESMSNCGVVFDTFTVHGGEQGVFAIIGPSRMNYAKVIPLVNLITNKLDQAVFGWK